MEQEATEQSFTETEQSDQPVCPTLTRFVVQFEEEEEN